MSLEGNAITEYASLSGRIHTLMIDKSLSVSGAAADARATGEAIAKVGGLNPDKMLADIQKAQATADAKAATATYTATVTNTWTASGDYFYQDIAVTGIKEADNPLVDIVLGSDSATNETYLDAFYRVLRITTSANSIRVWATKATETAFTIQLKVVR